MTLAKTPVDKRRRRSKPKESAEAYWQARARLKLLKRNAKALANAAADIYEMLKKTPRDKTMIAHALPHAGLALAGPTTLRLRLIRGRLWQATLADLPLTGNGMTEEEAAQSVLRKLAAEYLSVEQDSSADPEKWHVLMQLVRRVTPTEPAQTVAVGSEAELTVGEWLDENAPELNESLAMAWRRGACARLYGRNPCRYQKQDLFAAWHDGFGAMSRYLEAGSVLACNSCLRALALAPPSRAK
jgi:hypothetical protein